ncbi:uncharacterized protein MONBRDRAFT_29428 [Monosiga brevicollis MX1]|uniref:MMS19 nucleotide excision repair protein n=1 Tax=Monosiga brevicollis TaxID=81824 RepID=A9VB24_MONBE|nr:uncharacterized protein MONBRDRAFT_29428 [Monosiga brevicollis MX1]EDQ85318.1 predicted protein [Monosiga brevicollis MX1]|eukprot:XP_001749939.1 hypothetical protein [Monosiga brevicollis MX1]
MLGSGPPCCWHVWQQLLSLLATTSHGFWRVRVLSGVVLAKFFMTRIQDQPSTLPALTGLNELHKMNRTIFHGMAAELMTDIMKNVFVPAQAQPLRHQCFLLDAALLKTHLTELQTLGQQFVVGFVQQIDGEKDPRCLTQAFDLVPFVAKTFALTPNLTTALFEAISCYFPITFHPPPNDPYGITHEGLVAAHQACLSAHDAFAGPTIELVLDKLGSTIDETKMQCFETLAVVLPRFTVLKLLPYINKLYAAIRGEIYATAQEKSCYGLVCSEQSAHGDGNSLLSRGESSLLAVHGKLIVAAALASARACTLVFTDYVRPAADALMQTSQDSMRRAIGAILVDLLRAGSMCGLDESQRGLVLPIAQQLQDIMAGFALTRDDGLLQSYGVQGMMHFCELEGNAVDERQAVETTLHVLDQASPTEPLVALEAALECLGRMSQRNAAVVTDQLLQRLVAWATGDAVWAPIVAKRFPELFLHESAEPFVAQIFSTLFSAPTSSATLGLLQSCMVEASKHGALVQSLLPDLFQRLIEAACAAETLGASPQNPLCLGLAALVANANQRFLILASVPQQASQELQFSLLAKALDELLQGNAQSHPLCHAVICNLTREVSPALKQEAPLVQRVLAEVAKCSDDEAALRAAAPLATLLNKNPDALPYAELEAMVQSSPRPGVMSAIVYKALATQHHSSTTAARQQFVTLAVQGTLQMSLGTLLGFILEDDGWRFSRQGHCVVRLLYKQRVSQELLPALIEAHGTLTAEGRSNVLQGLASILEGASAQFISGQAGNILPLILKGVSEPDATLVEASLRALQRIMRSTPAAVDTHTHDVITRLLSLVQPQALAQVAELDAIKVARIQPALPGACSYVAPLIPALLDDQLMPDARVVIRQLQVCLNDRKRVVRNAAVKCRSIWIAKCG